MGTRHLTLVKHLDKFPVAQYGQWDGYPSGQGINILRFVSGQSKPKINYNFKTKQPDTDMAIPVENFDRGKFIAALEHTFVPTEEQQRSYWASVGVKLSKEGNNWVTFEQGQKFYRCYPSLSRDTGSDVLKLVQRASAERPVPLLLAPEFATDTTFCEWVWLLDLDANRVEAYRNYPVPVVASYDLLKPPTEEEFMAMFEVTEQQ